MCSSDLERSAYSSREQIEEMAFAGNLRSVRTWWARQSLAYPDPRRQQRYEVQAWRLGELTIRIPRVGECKRGVDPKVDRVALAGESILRYRPARANVSFSGRSEEHTSELQSH